jgi:hypothetical protein
MTRPKIQIGNEVREMNDAEYAQFEVDAADAAATEQAAAGMKWLAIAALVTMTACETTRSNSQKGVTRPTYCYPVDRC